MRDQLFFEEEEQLKKIRTIGKKRDINDLNRKDLSETDLDEIFCSN